MKKFTLIVGFVVLLSTLSFAQRPAHRTCGTDEAMKKVFESDPKAKQRYEQMQIMLEKQLYSSNPSARLNRTQAITTVPVVIHILLTNPNQVTDATIQNQLDTLNWFYGNASSTDSLRVYTPFRTTYGRSDIRFCKAVRDPNDQPTTGINRITSSTSYTAGGTHPSTIAPAWNTNKYLNIWVVNFTDGTLGYSYTPGTFAPGDQRAGFVNDYRAFGSNASYLDPTYNLGRTAVHEIGHYFNLLHPWGSGGSNPGCTGTDGCADTPPTNGPTFGCPAAPVLNSCSSSAPGVMNQNHMDYADDACMFLFTKDQVTRINAAINASDRVGLITSQGCQAVNILALDASIASITSPTANQGFCGTTTISPIVVLKNSGSTTLISATITVSLDGGPVTNYPWSGSLASQASVTVNLANITGLSAGNHNLNICVINPNGGTDLDNTNNCKTVSFSIISGGSGGLTPPLTEGFEGSAYPPTGWTLTLPTGQTATTPPNWDRVTGTGKTGTACIREKWWDHPTGRIHFLNLPVVNYAAGNFDNAYMSFHYAFKAYNATSGDSLAIQVSTDCGTSWTTVWERGRQGLATATGFQTSEYLNPPPSDWTQTPVVIDLTPYKNGALYIRLRGRSGFGNNLYLDDINLYGTINTNNDAGITAINSPASQACATTFTPQVVVKNTGVMPLTSVTVRYKIDNGTEVSYTASSLSVASNASTTITFPSPTTVAAGPHTFKAYTSNPNGIVDQQQSNDTLSKSFTVFGASTIPLVEGFESTTFPPAGWRVINPDNGLTWVRNTAASKTGVASATINFFNYATAGQTDILVSPLVNFAGFTSGAVSFQYAYKPYSATFFDSLTVVVSTDCGATWNTVWQKWGAALNPTTGVTTADFVPTAADWTSSPVKIDLTAYVNSGNIFIGFRGGNGFGNNLFIDDINIAGVYNYDMKMESVTRPIGDECSTPLTPTVKVSNNGSITTTSLKVAYQIDGGTPVVTTFTGLNILKDKDTTLNLSTINALAAGSHTFKVYSYEPNGQADQFKPNDTLSTTFVMLTNVDLPLKEGFETNTSAAFPPTGWQITQNPTDAITWARISSPRIVASEGSSAARVDNYNYAFADRQDNLMTPVLKVPATFDSVLLKFDVAHISYEYPGSTAVPLDTLQVELTRDCGKTWTSIYKKWGADLQTINQPNSSYLDSFIVSNKNQWRTDSVKLTGIVSANDVIRLRFKNIENYGNNTYIDNINMFTKTLAAKVKANGYMISPNPVKSTFVVQHYLTPTTLKGVGVYNSIGQRLMYLNFNSNAESIIPINMSGFAAGVYTIKLVYTNKTVAERIIKL